VGNGNDFFYVSWSLHLNASRDALPVSVLLSASQGSFNPNVAHCMITAKFIELSRIELGESDLRCI